MLDADVVEYFKYVMCQQLAGTKRKEPASNEDSSSQEDEKMQSDSASIDVEACRTQPLKNDQSFSKLWRR